MSESKIRFFINLIASFSSFFLSMGIGFVLTPYIVNAVSVEAYGFVGLTNSMVGYASILTVALNSVAGRFITISWHRRKYNEAASIMSSVVITNAAIAIVLLLVGSVVICFLEKLIDIPANLVWDVKVLLSLVILNFSLSIINVVFSVSTFITDKLYLSSILSIFTALLRVLLLVCLFYIFPANIIYVGLAAALCTATELLVNIWYKRRLVPELKLSLTKFDWGWIRILFGAGVWSSLASIGGLLSDGFDLLICNIWLGAYLAGQLSVSKVIQSAVAALLNRVTALYAPRLTKNFALDDIPKLVFTLKTNMKMTGFAANIIYASVVSLGMTFFELWMPGKDVKMLYCLTVISLSGLIVSGATNGLNNVYLITNQIKVNSLFWISIGVFDFLVVILLLNFTDMGVYAIAGVSIVMGTVSNFLFVPMYAAKCLKVKLTTFYNVIVRYIGCTMVMICVFYAVYSFFMDTSIEWYVLIKNSIILLLLGMIINAVILLNRSERTYILEKMNDRVKEWRK